MRTSSRPKTAVGAVVGTALAVAAAGYPAASLAGDTPPTEELSSNGVVLHKPASGTRMFTGFVKSRNANCLDHRKVTLYRKTSPSSTFVKRVAYTYAEKRTDGSSAVSSKPWTITVVRSGYYYARVEATDQCKARKSKPIHFVRPI
jgi:hypothetical protein